LAEPGGVGRLMSSNIKYYEVSYLSLFDVYTLVMITPVIRARLTVMIENNEESDSGMRRQEADKKKCDE